MHGRKGRYGQFVRWIFSAVDLLIVNLAYFSTCWWVGFTGGFYSRLVWLLLNACYIVVIYFFSDIHDRRVVYADRVAIESLKSVALHAAIFVPIISFINYVDVSWFFIIKFYGLLFVCLSLWWLISRKLLKGYRMRGFNYKRIIVIGAGSMGKRVIDELRSDQGYGYKFMGFFDDREPAEELRQDFKGRFDDVEAYVHDHAIDEMFCTVPDTENHKTVTRMLKIAENNAVDFYYAPQFGPTIRRQFELHTFGNVPLLSVRPNPLSLTLNRLIKRSFDLTISSVLMLLSPIVLIPVAIGIKLSSPGPIFFKQRRTGYRGVEFNCYKFRSMKVNKDSDTVQATADDPRKTRFGDLLRRTSIDELPQIFNVFRGDMSFVGPRPHMVAHTEMYSALIDKYMLRHVIKPGITGWAQVNGYRGQTDELWKMEKRVEYDVWYAENWNFMLDLKIILLTVWNVIKGEKNAF